MPVDSTRPQADGCKWQLTGDLVRRFTPAISWPELLNQVFDIEMRHRCSCGGGEFKIIAAILERPVIKMIFIHLGLDPQSPRRGMAREARVKVLVASFMQQVAAY